MLLVFASLCECLASDETFLLWWKRVQPACMDVDGLQDNVSLVDWLCVGFIAKLDHIMCSWFESRHPQSFCCLLIINFAILPLIICCLVFVCIVFRGIY